MNDFLRPCNCVHPLEEDCEKCVEETVVKPKADECCGSCSQEGKPDGVPAAEKQEARAPRS